MDEERLTRRQFLEKAAVAVGFSAAVGAAAVAIHKTEQLIDAKRQPPTVTPPTPTVEKRQELQFAVGLAEQLSIPGLGWYPDGHTSFLRQADGSLKMWVAGGPRGYLLTTNNFTDFGTGAREVIRPSNTESFDRNYAGPGSVIPGKNKDELFMLYHGEYHPNAPDGFPFNAGIGLAVSKDNGQSFERKGQIIKGKNNLPAKDRVYGAGQPCAIVKDGYVYLYYIDWNGQDPDAIHLARSPLDAGCQPGSFEKYNNGRFENTGMAGPSTPIVLPLKRGYYTALPGVSWNTELNKFLMICESNDGFYVSTSLDGVKWGPTQLLLQVKTANLSPFNGDAWNSYPTLLSPEKSSDRETGKEMVLVYSEGRWKTSPHHMVKRRVSLV